MFDVAPAQLNPNSFKIMCCAFILYRRLFDSTMTVRELVYFYNLKPCPGIQGYYHLVRWPKEKKLLIKQVPLSGGDWKEKIFRV